MSYMTVNKLDAAQAKATLDHGMALGTPVMTLDGELPVEFLSVGDRVLTRAGSRRLKAIEITLVRNARVVRISEGTLANDRPAADTIVTPDQPILVRDWRAKAIFGTDVAMISAARLCDGEYIRTEVLDEVRLFSLRFEEDVVIYAAGLELACAAVMAEA